MTGADTSEERLSWRVEGMDCPSCAAKVEKAVARLPGVHSPRLNFTAERLSLALAEGTRAEILAGQVESSLAALGYQAHRLPAPRPRPGPQAHDPAPDHRHAHDHVGEATCRAHFPGHSHTGCEHAGHDHAGHNHTGHNHTGHDHVGHDKAGTAHPPHGHAQDDAQAAGAHNHGGLAHAHSHDDPAEAGMPLWRTAKARLLAGIGLVALLGWLLANLFPGAAEWIYAATTLVAVFPFARRALALARAGSPFSIETLMVVAALGAAAIGAAGEAMTVVFLFALGELLEGVAAGRARAGIQSLVALMPRTALRLDNSGNATEIPAADLAEGDRLLVRPGERVPADGIIEEGRSALDESPVTGESIPVPRGPGEPAVAGSIATDGALRLRVTRAGEDSTLARIAALVAEASASRGRAQRFVERFANWWTPGAMAVAALTILVPPLLLGGDWSVWLYRGLALLLVACPCALVISVPAAMASGLSAGARHGLLVKGGAALEAIGGARTIAFDKTGTLTEGRPRLTDLVPAGTEAEDDLLALAAAVESGSAHPLARAITEAAATRGLAIPEAHAAGAIPGKAVTARIGTRQAGIGSIAWAEAGTGPLPAPLATRRDALQAEGKTVSALVADGRLLALLALRDEPRADAARAIATLKRQGVATVMLTGDNPRTAAAIAARLGLEARAGLLPEDKLREIAALKSAGPVAMVGDGINDAPALAAASTGIAMGGGTEAALEAADAALLHGRVTGVAELVALSRDTLRNIRQNVGIAVGLKALFLVTTLAGITGLWPAILADTGATVLVTLNALRLLAWKPARA
ncbi:heavy metal translocating P-type ATPase [Roseomonas gilardii]|nr:heavy metal translocating P-type ATPase [Roseomonas gilardii]SUE43155.1 Lead, cadmium, zinc and mercury-transporting ATPase [Roseomonas gilardii subsp. rosea]